MEGIRFPAVDPWEPYALLSLDGTSDLTVRPSRSWLWKERSVVGRSLTLAALGNLLLSSTAIIQKITAL
jgi:hypothetical protein